LCKLLNLCSDFIPTSISVLAHLSSLATNWIYKL
jgi:hypothetical protein